MSVIENAEARDSSLAALLRRQAYHAVTDNRAGA